jgi:signal transduction histidine kinase
VLIESRPRLGDPEPVAEEPARRSLLAGVRSRVLISFVALLVVSTVASVLVLRQVLLSRIDDRAETELNAELEPVGALEGGRPGSGAAWTSLDSLFDTFLSGNPPPPHGLFAAFKGERLVRSVPPRGSGPIQGLRAEVVRLVGEGTTPRSGTLETADGEGNWVAVPVSVGEQRGMLIAASLTQAERDQVIDAVWLAVGVSAVVLLLASLFIWLAAGHAIAPLNALSRMARSISHSDLSARIPVRGGDEIAELGHTFNGMLDRLEAAFAGQKDFLTDASHELRTPITVIRGYIETLGDSPREREEAIAVIQDELDRMSRYVDDLLLLTKAPRPDFLRPGPVDLDLFTHDLFAKARGLGERDWRLEATGVGTLHADQHRLTQAVMNLVENATRHTREGEAIWIGSSLIDREARLWVRDEGPGILEEDQERIFRRFERAGSSPDAYSGQGFGLGLAIVLAVTEAHNGRVELVSSPGKGASFTIVLPAAAQA